MLLTNSIQGIIDRNQDQNPLYLRNLIKEELQNYLLNFVFTSPRYNQLIFTGGTCLRKVYGLNRLSEDLDFDYLDTFSPQDFASDATLCFTSVLQYPAITFSISGNQQTVYFKFPLLKELGNYPDRTPEDIFVRCDFSHETVGEYVLEKNMVTAGMFQFFVTSYDLPTLFANKLVAFLERVFYQGKFQRLPFKGRDVYDFYWLMQLSAKSAFQIKPNPDRLQALFDNKDLAEIKKDLRLKIQQVDTKFVYQDLLPLMESREILTEFTDSYQSYILKYLDFVL